MPTTIAARHRPYRFGTHALLAACITGTAAAQVPDAQRFPLKPIRLISPFPPGGSNDILARFLAQKMSERLGQQTLVDNRPGAAGIIGTELAARAPADGHTLVMIATTYAQVPALHKTPYDPIASFAPITLVATGPNAIFSHASFAATSVRDLITLARSRLGEVRYASTGIGGFNHFAAELFNQLAKVKLTHIPYKGGGPTMIDVMSGQVEVMFGSLIQALPHIRAGKLKAQGARHRFRQTLAVASPSAGNRRSRSGIRRQHLVGHTRTRRRCRPHRDQAQYRHRCNPARSRYSQALYRRGG